MKRIVFFSRKLTDLTNEVEVFFCLKSYPNKNQHLFSLGDVPLGIVTSNHDFLHTQELKTTRTLEIDEKS